MVFLFNRSVCGIHRSPPPPGDKSPHAKSGDKFAFGCLHFVPAPQSTALRAGGGAKLHSGYSSQEKNCTKIPSLK
jgi:hypothetical protein